VTIHSGHKNKKMLSIHGGTPSRGRNAIGASVHFTLFTPSNINVIITHYLLTWSLTHSLTHSLHGAEYYLKI
jgi:hypothetical protein